MKLLLLFLFTTSVFAIQGEYADSRFELPSSCKLVFKVPEGEGICSASFVGNKSFVTANHCNQQIQRSLQIKEKPYFICPGSPTQYPVTSSGFGHTLDVAMIKVAKEVAVAPLEIASPDEAKKHLQESNCFINGYGYDNEKKYGTLKAAKVIDLDTSPLLISSGDSAVVRIRKNIGVEGDSGGPLYCQTPNGPRLVGVIHGKEKSDLAITDIHRVDKMSDWMSYFKNNNSPSADGFKALESVHGTCMAMDKCLLKLESTAKLSKDVAAILKALNKSALDARRRSIAGEKIDPTLIDKKWEEMIQAWQKYNCYQALNPN